MPICEICGHNIAQCQCRTNAEDVFYAVDSLHRHYDAVDTEPDNDDFFKEETLEENSSYEEGFDYLDFNNDWED